MENTSYLYDTLVQVLRQHRNWMDLRHLKTLAWMMVGLIHSGSMSLCAWTPFVISRAQESQSTVRRFRRWLANETIDVHALYGPLMQQALVGWVNKTLSGALDTSMLWDTSCMVLLSVIYRGRAVPLVWMVIEHGSATVASDVYKALLDRAAMLLPFACRVVFVADRGFADTKLMRRLKQMGWHFRIRIKENCWIDHRGQKRFQVRDISLVPGQARFWHRVMVTGQHCGPVHLAVARPVGRDAYWDVISDEPTEVKTLEEYGLRFDIAENFLDDKSGTFQMPVDSFQKASGGSRMLIRITNRYDSSASPTTQRQHDEVYQTPRFRSPDPYPYRHACVAQSRRLRQNDANRPGVSDIADLSLSTPVDGTPPVGNTL
jgi:hypothetical protein